MKVKNHNDRGFTLIEVLVVIVISAIVVGLSAQAFERIRSRASSAVCTGKLRQLGVAVNAYAGEHGLRFPTLVAARDSRSGEGPSIDTALLDYVNDEEAFRCPSDHQGIFQKTGTSYFWNSLINGQRTGSMDFLGLTKSETGIPIISDKENFHKNVGDEVNILYADGHVNQKIQFTADAN